MRIIYFLLLLPLGLMGQDCNIGRTQDQFTKEKIVTGPIQAIYTEGALGQFYINIALAKVGNRYVIAYDREFYQTNKEEQRFDITDGTKLMFRFANDTVIVATYKGKPKPPAISYDRTFGNWIYKQQAEFELTEAEFNKIPAENALAMRFDSGVWEFDVNIREKFRRSFPQVYLANIANCLRSEP